MNNSTIKDLFYGNNINYENLRPTKKYFEISNNINELENEFLTTLNIEQQQMYNKIKMLNLDCLDESSEYHFIEGFKLGVKLGIECTTENLNNNN